jgi:hypothetical protein
MLENDRIRSSEPSRDRSSRLVGGCQQRVLSGTAVKTSLGKNSLAGTCWPSGGLTCTLYGQEILIQKRAADMILVVASAWMEASR